MSDQGKIELTGLRGGKFQGFKVKEEPKALDSVGGSFGHIILWLRQLKTVRQQNTLHRCTPKKEDTTMAAGFKGFLRGVFGGPLYGRLMLILVAYSFAGAALFQWLEGKHEVQEKQEIRELRDSIIDRIFYTSRCVWLCVFPMFSNVIVFSLTK